MVAGLIVWTNRWDALDIVILMRVGYDKIRADDSMGLAVFVID